MFRAALKDNEVNELLDAWDRSKALDMAGEMTQWGYGDADA